MTDKKCPKCGVQFYHRGYGLEICTQTDNAPCLRRQLAAMTEEKEKAERDRNTLLEESADFQGRIASALGWPNGGVDFVDSVKSLRAENEMLVGQDKLHQNIIGNVLDWFDNFPLASGDELVTAERASIKADNERLRAIVDKLPKTADGVALTHGMVVWYVSRYINGPQSKTVLIDTTDYAIDDLNRDDYVLYSTREAALAAKENEP